VSHLASFMDGAKPGEVTQIQSVTLLERNSLNS